MNRNRLRDFRVEMDVSDLGICDTDQARVSRMVNSAQRRLLIAPEAGDEGWWGSWAEMLFTASRTSPYVTLPRHVARVEKMNVCQKPVPLNNQFYEYLAFGAGNLPKLCALSQTNVCKWSSQAYSRNNVVFFRDMAAGNYLRIYPDDTSGVDVGTAKRVLVQGLDSNGARIYSTENNYQVDGVFVTLEAPFVDVNIFGVPIVFSQVTGIQKDITVAPLQFKQVDPTTGSETLLHIMEPTEQTANYRRYYLDALPNDCCDGTGSTVQVNAIAKLEVIPVVADTDYLLIQNLEALYEECQSIRYGAVDSTTAKQMATYHHKEAIRLLQGELSHYVGKLKPAVSFEPFGGVNMSLKGIGMI